MGTFYCSCEQKHQIWGEVWWAGGKYDWVFFDDRETSETYTEQRTHCSICGQRLELKHLKTVAYQA